MKVRSKSVVVGILLILDDSLLAAFGAFDVFPVLLVDSTARGMAVVGCRCHAIYAETAGRGKTRRACLVLAMCVCLWEKS